jgi:hypothetical protein
VKIWPDTWARTEGCEAIRRSDIFLLCLFLQVDVKGHCARPGTPVRRASERVGVTEGASLGRHADAPGSAHGGYSATARYSDYPSRAGVGGLAQRAFMGLGFDGCNFLPDHALNWGWTLHAMKCLLFESGVPTLTWRAGPGSQGEGTRQ